MLRATIEAEIVNAAEEESHCLETISGVQSNKLFKREDYRLSKWLTRTVDMINAEIRTEKLQIHGTSRLIFSLEATLVMWLDERGAQ